MSFQRNGLQDGFPTKLKTLKYPFKQEETEGSHTLTVDQAL